MTYFIEVRETRRFAGVIEARSQQHALERASQLHRDGELPGDVLDQEVIAFPC